VPPNKASLFQEAAQAQNVRMIQNLLGDDR